MPRLRIRLSGPGVKVGLADRRMLVDEDDDEDVGRVVDRAITLAHLDVGEASAAPELFVGLPNRLVGDEAADRETGQGEHVGIRRRVVAVHAHFAQRLGNLRRCGAALATPATAPTTSIAAIAPPPRGTCGTRLHGLILVVTSASR